MPVIVVVIIILGFFAYNTFFKPSGTDTQNLSSTGSQASAPIGQDFLNLLLQIKDLNIDPSIFSNPVYLSLQDDGLPIVDEPVGRDNPFAPLTAGSDSVGTSTTSLDFSTQPSTSNQ